MTRGLSEVLLLGGMRFWRLHQMMIVWKNFCQEIQLQGLWLKETKTANFYPKGFNKHNLSFPTSLQISLISSSLVFIFVFCFNFFPEIKAAESWTTMTTTTPAAWEQRVALTRGKARDNGVALSATKCAWSVVMPTTRCLDTKSNYFAALSIHAGGVTNIHGGDNIDEGGR